MTGREYMMQYWEAVVRVRRLKSQSASIRDLLGNVTVDPSSEHVQTSRDPDQIGKLVAKLSDVEESRKRIVRLAMDLAVQGKVTLPSRFYSDPLKMRA